MEVLSYKDKPTNLVARAWKSILYVYILPFPTPVQVDKTFSINTSYAFYHFPILEGELDGGAEVTSLCCVTGIFDRVFSKPLTWIADKFDYTLNPPLTAGKGVAKDHL